MHVTNVIRLHYDSIPIRWNTQDSITIWTWMPSIANSIIILHQITRLIQKRSKKEKEVRKCMCMVEGTLYICLPSLLYAVNDKSYVKETYWLSIQVQLAYSIYRLFPSQLKFFLQQQLLLPYILHTTSGDKAMHILTYTYMSTPHGLSCPPLVSTKTKIIKIKRRRAEAPSSASVRSLALLEVRGEGEGLTTPVPPQFLSFLPPLLSNYSTVTNADVGQVKARYEDVKTGKERRYLWKKRGEKFHSPF